MRLIVVGHTAFTLAMFGVMWTVQTVVYPQFRNVEPEQFASYAAAHNTGIMWTLVLLAPAEVIFAGWLFLDPPAGLSRGLIFFSGLLLAIAWVSTGLYFGPFHGRFQGPYDRSQIDLLINTNWIRTGLWTARAVLAMTFVWQLLKQVPAQPS